jgi:hypothetical protein
VENETEARNSVPYGEARDSFVKWKNGDREVVDLWKMMNSWVRQWI